MLFALAVLFGVYQLFQTKDIFSLVILGAQVIALVLTFITVKQIKFAGGLVFGLTLVMSIIYGFVKNDIRISKRVLILFSAGWVLFIYLVPVFHRNDLRILGLAMIIPIGAYIVLLAKDLKSYRNELGFLTIILIAGLSQFIESLEIFDIIRLPFT